MSANGLEMFGIDNGSTVLKQTLSWRSVLKSAFRWVWTSNLIFTQAMDLRAAKLPVVFSLLLKLNYFRSPMMVVSWCSYETRALVEGAPSAWGELCESFSDWLLDAKSDLSETDDCTWGQRAWTLIPHFKCPSGCLARIRIVLCGTIELGAFPL